MDESTCLSKMVAPGMRRPYKYREGVIQILLTSSCDKSCWNCTQNSQLRHPFNYMSTENFEKAVLSLQGYFGVYACFGGNPALVPNFEQICEILRKHVPYEQRGIWCNNPITLEKAQIMRRTFNPSISNLNVHLDQKAYDLFKLGWPECGPVGLHQDSRHSPCFVAMKDLEIPEEERWDLISKCEINQHWSAGIGVFRDELRAWFCEITMAQSILHQYDPDYPDTGVDPTGEFMMFEGKGLKWVKWWEMPMQYFSNQVRKHCHECSVPLNGYGELAQAKDGTEQVSKLHQLIYKPKNSHRRVELVTSRKQLEEGKIESVVKYIQNASK